jgi:hypothetical protein
MKRAAFVQRVFSLGIFFFAIHSTLTQHDFFQFLFLFFSTQ